MTVFWFPKWRRFVSQELLLKMWFHIFEQKLKRRSRIMSPYRLTNHKDQSNESNQFTRIIFQEIFPLQLIFKANLFWKGVKKWIQSNTSERLISTFYIRLSYQAVLRQYYAFYSVLFPSMDFTYACSLICLPSSQGSSFKGSYYSLAFRFV